MPILEMDWACVSKREQRTHLFDISGHGGAFKSDLLVSEKFSVGEHDWTLLFWPDEESVSSSCGDCSVVSLFLIGKKTKAQSLVEVELRLFDKGTGRSLSLHKEVGRVFDLKSIRRFLQCKIKHKLLEESTYLQNDCLTVESIVTVITKPQAQFPRVEVPPSDIADHFGKLLETKEGVDVTFSVGGVNFTAHKMLLATRSPVFRAELYGPMREGGNEPIVIEDIQPEVFKALIHFMYRDTLPPFDDLEADDYVEMIRHLLVAADRYAMERLKLMCQSILCESLHVQTVATTLALADQHQCDILKGACIEFVTSSNAMDAVAATQGYKSLKRTCPFIAIELLKKTSRIYQP
jgi:speckle-type POZ protein